MRKRKPESMRDVIERVRRNPASEMLSDREIEEFIHQVRQNDGSHIVVETTPEHEPPSG